MEVFFFFLVSFILSPHLFACILFWILSIFAKYFYSNIKKTPRRYFSKNKTFFMPIKWIKSGKLVLHFNKIKSIKLKKIIEELALHGYFLSNLTKKKLLLFKKKYLQCNFEIHPIIVRHKIYFLLNKILKYTF